MNRQTAMGIHTRSYSKRNFLHLRGKYASIWNGLNRPRSTDNSCVWNCCFFQQRFSILSSTTFRQFTAKKGFSCTWIYTVLSIVLSIECVYTVGTTQSSSPLVNTHTVQEGDSVLLPCNLPESMFSSLSWSVDGRALVEQHDTYTSPFDWPPEKGELTPNFSLQIFSVVVEDSGEYSCKVLNLGNVIATVTHHLIVEVDRPLLQHANSNLVLSEGSRLSLTCNGLFPLEWMYPAKDSKVEISSHLTPPVNRSLLTSIWKERSTLTVDNLTIEDSGEYRCSHRGIQESAKEKWSAAGVFITEESGNRAFLPVIDSPITVFPGQPFTIPCRSYPNTTIVLRPTGSFLDGKGSRRERRAYLDSLPYLNLEGFFVDEYHSWFGKRMRCFVKEGGEEQFFNLTVVDVPSISVGPEVILEEAATLKLSCTGLLRILWSFPVIEDSPIPQLASQRDSETGLFTSLLTINAVKSSSSGNYSCFYSIFRDELQAELRRSTYIYVASKDVDFLPVPEGGDKIHISGNSFVIPCRVNNPNTTVMLELCYLEQRQCQDSLLAEYNRSYESKTGFHLVEKTSSKATPTFNLQAHCSTSRNDRQQFYLFFEDGEDSGLMMEVTASSYKVFTNSAELNITCKVDFLKLLLVDENLRPKLTWDFPQTEVGDHFTLYNEHTTITAPTFSFYSHLRLFNVSSNPGSLNFTCYASNNMFRSQMSLEVDVYEDPFINFYNLNSPVLESYRLYENDNLCLKVRVVAFPSFMVFWEKDGYSIYAHNATDLNITEEGDQFNRTCSLCFDSPDRRRTGNYTVVAGNEYTEKELSFQVEVLVPPSITTEIDGEYLEMFFTNGSQIFYYSGNSYGIYCEADGYPIPVVHWEYSECKALSTDNEKCIANGRRTERITKETVLPYIDSVGEETLGSNELYLYATEESAIFKCIATSEDFPSQPAESSIRFLVLTTDEPIHFKIPGYIYINQPVKLECSVNGFSFKDPVIVRKIDNITVTLDFNDKRFSESSLIQDNSRKRTVNINSVRLEDSGDYYCIAMAEEPHSGDFKEKKATLTVREIIAAEVFCTDHDIVHDVNAGDLVVNCTVTGDPKPTAKWEFVEQPSLNKAAAPTDINFTTIIISYTIPVEYFRVGVNRTLRVIGQSGGQEGSTDITLMGVESPHFPSPKEDVEEVEGMNLSISCFAMGHPQPVVVWEKLRTDNKTGQVEISRLTVIDGVYTFLDAEVSDSGIYVCTASNDYGSARMTYNVTIKPADKKPGNLPSFSIILIAISAGFCFLLVVGCLSQRRKSEDHQRQYTLSELNEFNRGGMYPMHMQGMMAEEIYERLPYDPRWEFTRERLILGPVIGRGAFGMVIKAKAVGIENINRSTIVAVKTLKDEASDTEKKALWAELKLLAHVGRHLNVVNFLGACTTGSPLLLIVEFCTYGNLSDYLRKRRRVFYGSLDNTGSDSSHVSTSTSFPNMSNESGQRPVREKRPENHQTNNQTTSTGETCDSAIGNSPADSPFFSKTKGTITSINSHNIRLKSRSSFDLTNTDSLPKHKETEKSSSNDSGNELTRRETKRMGLTMASSMGSLNRSTINQIRNAISPSQHPPFQFENSLQSAFELPLREEDLICYSFQTARGMDFLSSKQVIHRDLAARNVLLTDSNVVKICDFGLARHLYQNPDYIASGKGRFPVKWMAPESIFDKVYTTQTDIWSFGVLLWEIFSLGGSPYPGLQMDENFYSKLKEGYRMSPPEIAPPEIGDIMYECWNDNPKERPPFSELEMRLGDLLAASTRLEYVEMNNPYQNMTAELEAQQQEHLKETALLLPADSFESLSEPPASPSGTETATENSNEPPSLSDFHQTTVV